MSEIRTDTINNASGDNDSGIDLSTNDQVGIKTANTTAVTVDASQNVGIGTASPDELLELSSGSPKIKLTDTNNTIGQTGLVANISAEDSAGTATWVIGREFGSTALKILNKQGSSTIFETGGSERTRIIDTGFFKTGNLGGTYRSVTGTFHEMITDKSGDGVATFSMTNASYAGGGFQVVAARTATGDTYRLFEGYSGNGADREFRVDSDGTVHADGAYSATGADYAEMFEWSDGNTTNEDRVGKTVVLDGNQIRLSTSSDAQSSIIGVVSARPVVLGDAQSEKWVGKYETDDFGRYIREEYTQTEWIEEDEDGNKSLKSYQTDLIPSDITVPSDAIVTSTEVDGVTPLTRRRLNPSYDPSQTYIPREQRKEFSPIGLVGKLKVRVGQTVGDRWIKMREISDTVHEYLVR